MANAITGLRILVSMGLLFSQVFSPIFYGLYLIAGLSEMDDLFFRDIIIKEDGIMPAYHMNKMQGMTVGGKHDITGTACIFQRE